MLTSTVALQSQVREAQALTQQLCDFLESAGGSAPTPDIIAHFGGSMPPSRMALLRQLLKQVHISVQSTFFQYHHL